MVAELGMRLLSPNSERQGPTGSAQLNTDSHSPADPRSRLAESPVASERSFRDHHRGWVEAKAIQSKLSLTASQPYLSPNGTGGPPDRQVSYPVECEDFLLYYFPYLKLYIVITGAIQFFSKRESILL